MSKIGKTPIKLPVGVKLETDQTQIKVIGPKGTLSTPLFDAIGVEIKDSEVRITRVKDDLQSRSYHGLVRSLINNYVHGVSQGYSKTLKLMGTGYRVKKKGQGIELSVGFSHVVQFVPPQGVQLEVEGEDIIRVIGINKQAVGQVASDIRSIRPPEPYQGKGIRYEDEFVKLKPGKAATEK
ncbi:MAG TPA: 50S ribosomal protein L6 [Candidatus Woesebacteria bacterium]|nr:50S ribosomal protein L6 [Candidatus Woesebacteria bacterium]